MRCHGLALAVVGALGCDLDRLFEGAGSSPPSTLPQGAAAGSHVALGAPYDASPQDELVLTKPQYVVSYNRFRNAPNWVAWRLTASDMGSVGRTRRRFAPDPQLPEGVYRVMHNDYAGSGFDHGHLCPSAERTATVDDNAATFVTTNIVPQRHDLNAGPWEALERWSVTMAARGWDLYIVAGASWPRACATDVYPAGNVPGEGCPSIGRSADPARRVAVPSSTWKVITLAPRGAGVEAITSSTPVVAVDMPNDGSAGADWRRYVLSVDALEARTGYEFHGGVAPGVQHAIEAGVYAGE
jgi:endonuclease G